MKNVTNMEEVFFRLQQGASVKSLTDLARALGVAQQSVFNARARGKIPDAWFRKVADLNNISIDWLTYGEGAMHRNMQVEVDIIPDQQSPKEVPSIGICGDCIELKKELTEERAGWREVVTENRQLWKEIAELREHAARLEERAGQATKGGTAEHNIKCKI